MSSNKKIAEFPNVEAKLQKPTKQSAFERQRAAAEAKKQREAAETAAVYEDFVKSFDQDEEDHAFPRGSRVGDEPGRGRPPDRPGAAPYGGGAGRRHFGVPSGPSMKSGPGSLGPPPSSFGKKRPYEGAQWGTSRDRDDTRGRLGFESQDSGQKPISRVFETSDDEEESAPAGRAEEKAISRPTLRLANLPPTTSPAVIKALIPSNLAVENIKIVPSSASSGSDRKCSTAIVTLSPETPATDIEAAVSSLQNRYLGFGFYLSLHRHLSSAAMSSSSLPIVASSSATSHPFGAKRVTEISAADAPQHVGFARGFAPPTSYGPPGGGPIDRSGILHVAVKPPKDIKKLRMIHKVIEGVLDHGPEFEALLMSRPDVQREEKWAWIWDARSEGGVWYRWRLWEIVTGSQNKRGQGRYMPLFEDSHAWKGPDQPLSYEYTTEIDSFVSDSEYNSSNDDDFDDEPSKQADGGGGNNEQEEMFLDPIEKSKLAHLLARLPTTLSKVRKGDIARVTAFAISHASKGSNEIADMIVSNISRPFAYTSANPGYKLGTKEGRGGEGEGDNSREASPVPADDKADNQAPDTSAARLVGLYVVSDILSSSSTSGVRHAWRYRQLFEAALRANGTFETLGEAAERQGWGRLRAEKWKRSIGLVFSLWESWCMFPAEAHELFVRNFENPPRLAEEARRKAEEEDAQKKAGRWKAVEKSSDKMVMDALPVSRKPPSREGSDVDDGDADRLQDWLETGDTDGELTYSYGVGSDDDGGEARLSDIDIDGLTLDGDDAGDDTATRPGPAAEEIKPVGGFQLGASTSKPAPPLRKRMRAVDMFAGSGSEDDK